MGGSWGLVGGRKDTMWTWSGVCTHLNSSSQFPDSLLIGLIAQCSCPTRNRDTELKKISSPGGAWITREWPIIRSGTVNSNRFYRNWLESEISPQFGASEQLKTSRMKNVRYSPVTLRDLLWSHLVPLLRVFRGLFDTISELSRISEMTRRLDRYAPINEKTRRLLGKHSVKLSRRHSKWSLMEINLF